MFSSFLRRKITVHRVCLRCPINIVNHRPLSKKWPNHKTTRTTSSVSSFRSGKSKFTAIVCYCCCPSVQSVTVAFRLHRLHLTKIWKFSRFAISTVSSFRTDDAIYLQCPNFVRLLPDISVYLATFNMIRHHT